MNYDKADFYGFVDNLNKCLTSNETPLGKILAVFQYR